MWRHPGTSENGKPLPLLDVDNSKDIIKQSKLRCRKLATSLPRIKARNSSFTAFNSIFTSNMTVVMSDPSITSAATHQHSECQHLQCQETLWEAGKSGWSFPSPPHRVSLCTKYCQMLFLKILSCLFFLSFKNIHNALYLKVDFEICATYSHVGSPVTNQTGVSYKSCSYRRMQLLLEPLKSRKGVRGINMLTSLAYSPPISCVSRWPKLTIMGSQVKQSWRSVLQGLEQDRKWRSMGLGHTNFTQLECRKVRSQSQVHDALVTAFMYSSTIYIAGSW